MGFLVRGLEGESLRFHVNAGMEEHVDPSLRNPSIPEKSQLFDLVHLVRDAVPTL